MGGDTMNNGMAQQNDALNQVPLVKTIDGIYRQRINNYNNYNQINTSDYPINSDQDGPIYIPTETNNGPTTTNQSIDGVYKLPANNSSAKYYTQTGNPQLQYNHTTNNNEGIQPTYNYRNARPKPYLQSVDGMTKNRFGSRQYNNYNSLYQQNVNHQNSSQAPQQQNYSNINQPQAEIHIPITSSAKPDNHSTQTNIDNKVQTEQQNIHSQRANYADNNAAKPKNTTYLDVVNTVLLISILSVTILILLNI